MNIIIIGLILVGIVLIELALLLFMEIYSRISDWWYKFKFNARID